MHVMRRGSAAHDTAASQPSAHANSCLTGARQVQRKEGQPYSSQKNPTATNTTNVQRSAAPTLPGWLTQTSSMSPKPCSNPAQRPPHVSARRRAAGSRRSAASPRTTASRLKRRKVCRNTDQQLSSCQPALHATYLRDLSVEVRQVVVAIFNRTSC
jgi:hypothetical protein